MSDARQLLRAGQACRSRTNHGDFFACFLRGDLWGDPTFFPALVDDGVLNGFDTNSIVVDVEGTGGFARGGTNSTCELRKVVGRMQNIQGAAPVLAVDQIIPIGNDVVNRAAVITKRNAAVHAARRLFAGLLVAQMQDKLFPVLESIRRWLGSLL